MSDSPSIPPSVQQRRQKAFAWLLLAAVAVAGAWVGFGYAKLHLALSRAHREFSNRQFMRAEFWAGRALSVDGKNVEATRLMAEINEAQDRPAALGWRIKVVQRAPGNTGDILAWAKSALRFGQTEMTLNALKSLPPDFGNRSAEFHELMAGCALAARETGLAEAHFVKAAEIGRDNPVFAVNVAAFRLTNSPDSEVRAQAARELGRALDDPRVNLFATRALLFDAVRNGDKERMRRFAARLRSLPEHNFTDDLGCLETEGGEPSFDSSLEKLEHHAESEPLWTATAGDWLNSHGMAAETLRWHARLPLPVRSNPRVQMTVAEGYIATKDWTGLEAFLAKCRWDDFEYLRRAMLIRCKRERAEPWEKEWKQLAAGAQATPPEGLLLSQLVLRWKWRAEAVNLLWGATTDPRTRSKALQYLWDIYSASKETRELLRVARAQLDLDPSNPVKKNNDAFLSLLLNGASERSERLAREASAANPKVPEWAATCAYALHLAGKDSEAKKIMANLAPGALERPGIALYSAIVQAANGDYAQAGESLARLNPAGMLPEERKLADDLRRELAAAGH